MKVKPPSSIAVEAARRVLREADVGRPSDIHIEAIAARHGAMVLYGPATTSRGQIMRVGPRAVIRVDARAEGTPPARFTIGHELGHHILHPIVDHFMQCDAEAKRSGRGWVLERQADDFSTEVNVPEALGAPLCTSLRPTLHDVDHLARTFQMSLEMSAIRFVTLAKAPCAAVLFVNGRIKWAPESLAFPGKIVKGRRPEPSSAAALLIDGATRSVPPREVPGEAWGGRAPFVEHAIRLARPGEVLTWVVPGA